MVSLEYSIGEFLALIEQYLVDGLLPTIAINKAIIELGKDYGLVAKTITVSGFPLYSEKASGRFREKVFVTRSGQETHIRPYVKPRDPKTPKQIVHREKFRLASLAWTKLTPEEKEPYNQLAKQEGKCSGFNLFIKEQIRSA